jgi:aldose sugar dehydrogenase
MKIWHLPALLFVAAVGTGTGLAQQTVPFSNGIPIAPLGLAGRRLPDTPMEFDTGEGQRIRVTVVTKALEYPWSLAFLPDGSMLVTERAGRLRIIRNGALDPQPIAGAPASYWAGESGLPGAVHGFMDVALHPRFAENRLLYLSYTKPLDEKRRTVAIARGRLEGHTLTGVSDIFVTGAPGTSRIAFARDGTLFVTTTGAPGEAKSPQDPNSLGGKVLRLTEDGGIPADNPFVGRSGHRPEVYTLGHRSSLGLAMHPGTGEMWQNENGPNGGDEINILQPGRNYGWPMVSFGRTYQGPWQSERPQHEGFEAPIAFWMPSIAVSGMAFYTGDRLPKWKGDVFVGALRTGEIPGTGHLERILFNEKMQELRREALLTELRQRIREVRQGPDGLLYLLTDEKEGAVLRIEPAS